MTQDQMQTLRDDIAFMRALAEEGRRAPMLGGPVMAAAGLIFGIASLIAWAIFTQLLDLPRGSQMWVWLAAFAVYMVVLRVLLVRMRGKPGAGAASNRAIGAAWSSVGWSIFVIGLALGVAAYRLHQPALMALFPSVILTMYGAAWGVSALFSGERWLWIVSLGSFASALAVAWFLADPVVFLIYAAAMFLLAFVPGMILARREPSDIV